MSIHVGFFQASFHQINTVSSADTQVLPELQPESSQTARHPECSEPGSICLPLQYFPSSSICKKKLDKIIWNVNILAFSKFLEHFPISGLEINLKRAVALTHCKTKSDEAEM